MRDKYENWNTGDFEDRIAELEAEKSGEHDDYMRLEEKLQEEYAVNSMYTKSSKARIAELEATLAAIKADARELLKGDYNAAYDLKNDLRALLGIEESEES